MPKVVLKTTKLAYRTCKIWQKHYQQQRHCLLNKYLLKSRCLILNLSEDRGNEFEQSKFRPATCVRLSLPMLDP